MTIYEQLRSTPNLPEPVRIAALRGALLNDGAQNLGLLKECLDSPDYTVFTTAVQASQEMRSPEVSRLLVESLSHVPADEQMVLVESLGQRGEAEALPALCKVVKEDAVARLAALRAIAAIGGPLAVNVMLENIISLSPAISQAARDGLAGIPGPKADAAVVALLADKAASRKLIGIELAERRCLRSQVPRLLKACDDADRQVRLAALRSVGELGSVDQVPTLITWIMRATEKSDCEAGAQALEAMLERAGKPASATCDVVSAMARAPAKQKSAFLGVLCSVGGSAALSAVRSELNDPDGEVRDAAVRALASWGDPSAATDLIKFLLSAKAVPDRELVFRGYVRLANDAAVPNEEKFKMLSQAEAIAAGPQDQKLVLSELGNLVSIESLRLVAARLSDPSLVDEASAAAVRIAAHLGVKYKDDIAAVLNRVLKLEKSQRLLDQARKCLEQFGSLKKHT